MRCVNQQSRISDKETTSCFNTQSTINNKRAAMGGVLKRVQDDGERTV